MAFQKKPVTGMKDILPEEMRVRNDLIRKVQETYGKFGFTQIETPIVESIGNLSGRQGGENEKLIFQILKRGEKLDLSSAQDEADLTDSGLRYDLTVPLARFYAAHAAELQRPFKALQIGPVFRAERPQRGRFREFYQCDIDILGESSNLAEIELILATTTLLEQIGFHGFSVHINDRRILQAVAASCGFPMDEWDRVFLILDKMDKIGTDGVLRELTESGFAHDSSEKICVMLKEARKAEDPLTALQELMTDQTGEDAFRNLSEIMTSVNASSDGDFTLFFDPTLVRGMSYYTGTIFEITVDGFAGSVAGGGRYDKMIGKFTGTEVPACGFSIGFERIVTILSENPGMGQFHEQPVKAAYLIEKGTDGERLSEVLRQAQEERAKGVTVLLSYMNKNKKFQKEQLQKEGYTEFREFYRTPLR